MILGNCDELQEERSSVTVVYYKDDTAHYPSGYKILVKSTMSLV